MEIGEKIIILEERRVEKGIIKGIIIIIII